MSEPKNNWVERISAKHNKAYWFNTDSGESSWVKPEELAP